MKAAFISEFTDSLHLVAMGTRQQALPRTARPLAELAEGWEQRSRRRIYCRDNRLLNGHSQHKGAGWSTEPRVRRPLSHGRDSWDSTAVGDGRRGESCIRHGSSEDRYKLKGHGKLPLDRRRADFKDVSFIKNGRRSLKKRVFVIKYNIFFVGGLFSPCLKYQTHFIKPQ